MSKVKIFAKSIAFHVIIGAIVGWIISSSIDYNSLQKPFLSPPSIAFPIVWTILYILMGVSYGILKNNEKVTGRIKLIYYVQLAVNALWSIFFFLLKWRLFSAVWIVLLAILVAIMVFEFCKLSKAAGILQIPYLVWVIFASYLNFAIYFLNR